MPGNYTQGEEDWIDSELEIVRLKEKIAALEKERDSLIRRLDEQRDQMLDDAYKERTRE